MNSPSPYDTRRQARSSFLPVNRLNYHLREWGDPKAPLLVMLHGWMDVSASFQFLVDALQSDWHVVAPDWRGYGLSDWTAESSYWMPAYMADLDAILDHYSPNQPARVIGHSMGGNIAGLYTGVRPQRVRAFINLEGLGLAGDSIERVPEKLQKWLGELRQPPTLSDYASLQGVVARLQKTNPRLSDARANFLAGHWSVQTPEGRYQLRADPRHKIINPSPYRADEATLLWSRIACPTLWVMARESDYAKKMDGLPDYAARLARIAKIERVWVESAAHMVHHDQPELLALLIEQFLNAHQHGFSDA